MYDLPTEGLNMPNGNPTDSCLAKSSANAFVNVYVFGQPAVKLEFKKVGVKTFKTFTAG